MVGWFIECYDSDDCEANEYCDMDQGDFNENGIGDACEKCFANCNCDTKIDLADLVIVKQEFLRTDCADQNPCDADCNGDNKVDLADLSVVKYEFLRTGCPICQ